MNAEECARLVSVVRTLYPAQRFDDNPENVVRAWGYVVADVEYAEAHAAVVRLARRGVQWVAPGDVRREAAAARNVLAPDVDALLADVREVARREGVGRRALHPVARRVYDSVGGALSIARMDARGLLQLRRVLDEQAQSYDRHRLDDVLPPPAPEHVAISAREVEQTRELEASNAELTPPELYGERAAELRAFLEGDKS
jgi:hypothetical protein